MPRGGAVHARRLAEELAARGHEVELWVLSMEGAGITVGPGVATHQVPLPPVPGEPIPARIERGAAVLAHAMGRAVHADINHAQDLLSARALLALRSEGVVADVVRTVHHVEAFPDRFLEECQRASIQDVDRCIAVSSFWADRLADEFGVRADVVPNGVDADRFAGCPLSRADAATRMGWPGRTVVLAVGGVQPRKGSRVLLEAFARARARLPGSPLLVIAGGDGLFAAPDAVDAWADDAVRLGLVVHRGPGAPAGADVARIGVVDDDDMPVLYRAADVLAFPSTREGFGLVVVEAMAAGLPVVTSDLPVLAEFLRDDEDCLMTPVGDSGPLSQALVRLANDGALRDRLTAKAMDVVRGRTWAATAQSAEGVYRDLLAG